MERKHWSLCNISYKAIIETSLLLLIAGRVPNPPSKIEKALTDLAKSLCPLVRNEHNKTLLMRIPQTAAIFGIGNIALSSFGLIDKEFDELIKRSFDSKEVYNTERVPYRIMDVIWLNNLIFPNVKIDFDKILPNTILTSGAHPIYMTPNDIYALTHSIMYVTDFGVNPLPGSIDKVRLSTVVDSAIAYHLLSDNLDILGELIMTASMMNIPWSTYVKIAWKLFTGIWDKLGFLPCPTFDSSAFKLLSGKEASSYAFKHLYHTTYVGGILCCILLEFQRTKINNVSVSIHDQPNLKKDKLLVQIEKCIDSANSFTKKYYDYSMRDFDAIGSNKKQKSLNIQRESNFIYEKLRKHFDQNGSANFLSSFIQCNTQISKKELSIILTDALLIHGAQDYNLALLIETFIYIVNSKISLSPTMYKTIEFIINQQVTSGAIGAYFAFKSNLETYEAFEITSELANGLFNIGEYIRELMN